MGAPHQTRVGVGAGSARAVVRPEHALTTAGAGEVDVDADAGVAFAWQRAGGKAEQYRKVPNEPGRALDLDLCEGLLVLRDVLDAEVAIIPAGRRGLDVPAALKGATELADVAFTVNHEVRRLFLRRLPIGVESIECLRSGTVIGRVDDDAEDRHPHRAAAEGERQAACDGQPLGRRGRALLNRLRRVADEVGPEQISI